MLFILLRIPDVVLIAPQRFADARGDFADVFGVRLPNWRASLGPIGEAALGADRIRPAS
ncbi:MAG: hypothetical protein ACREFZ_12415 [Acetobacteraceae bacterium]